ncbi:MAG: type II toxin-antitoxin system RelE/ParE family toxin [Waterburya sp.]
MIAPEAIKDLDAIFDYFSERNVAAGEKLLDEFQKKCRYLVQFPKIGRSYKEIRPYLRGLPLDGYIIFYRLDRDIIEIMRVVKGNRDLETLFNTE